MLKQRERNSHAEQELILTVSHWLLLLFLLPQPAVLREERHRWQHDQEYVSLGAFFPDCPVVVTSQRAKNTGGLLLLVGTETKLNSELKQVP